jgi:PAS domain S-box-containing protein
VAAAVVVRTFRSAWPCTVALAAPLFSCEGSCWTLRRAGETIAGQVIPNVAGRPAAGPERFSPRLRFVGLILALAALYFIAAKIGFLAALLAEQVSPVWPPTGIALWALLRFGIRAWPGIWLGAALANATTNVPIVPACVIAGGNALEAVAGVWLLHRLAGFERSLDTLREVVTLVIAAAFASTVISATIGVTTLCAWGLQPWAQFGPLWWTWWLGDASGALLVTPVLLTAPHWPWATRAPGRLGEFAVLEMLAITVSMLMFTRLSEILYSYPALFVFPLVMWAGLRFAHSGAALVSATVSAIAVWGTLQGYGPFSGRLTLLQIYTAVIAASGLIFGAAIADRNRAERLRDHAQRRRAESEALTRAVISASLDCIITIDADGKILEFNPAAVRTFGFRRGEVIGRELAELIVPVRLRERHRDALRRSVETGEGRILDQRLEMPACRADGTEVTVELAVTRVVSGPRPVYTAHLRDITDRKRIDHERAELLDRERAARLDAENANRAKDQFLATVSHELRTPLTAILGWASMLQARQFDPERVTQIYDRIFKNAQAQAQIINDLLDVSRIVTGRLRLDWQQTDVSEVARLGLETIRPTALAKGIALRSSIPGTGCVVSGDAARLQQVIWNLLSNAIKFTPAGGTVALSVRATGPAVEIEVTDTGIGIPVEFLPRLFERFWQADGTTTRTHGGLGIGLALVRHLVEAHGGEVEASSRGEGRGSTFVVRLPLRRAESPVPEPVVAEQLEGRPALQGLTALVVDDDPGARELFAAILESQGALVTCAESAADAMVRFERRAPHLLVIDIGMPGENGFELLKRIRAHEATHQLRQAPAIAVTAYAAAIDRDDALRAGFAAHVPKPVLPHQLLSIVRTLT